MKKLLILFLVTCFALSSASCDTSAGEEIADFSYKLDDGNGEQNYSYNKGLSDLKDLINGVYDTPGDINEMGRPVVSPIVEFDDGICMSADGIDFPTRLYYYLMCEFKYTEISQSFDFAIKAEDTPEYWNSLDFDSNKTIREVVIEKVYDIARSIIACELAYKDYDMEKGNTWQQSYDDTVANIFGNETALNEYYAAYGLDSELLKLNYQFVELYNEFYEHLVGVDGILYPSVDESKKYFEDECIYIEQIVFPYVEINESGHNVYKSDEKINESRTKGKELFDLINGDPKQFDRNMYKTEHPEWEENRNGYIYIPNYVLPEIMDACKKAEVGEVFAVDTPIGYYIIRNKEKTGDAFEMGSSKIITSHCQTIFKNEITKYFDRISVNQEQINKYTFEEVLVLK